MNMKKKEFLDFFDYLVQNCKEPVVLPDGVKEFYNFLLDDTTSNVDKPLLTESGLQILEYLQNNKGKNLKAKDIAEGMNISSRKVSGAIRKLVTDNFVDKFGKNPVIYSLTEKGKDFDIESYKKENLSNEKDN